MSITGTILSPSSVHTRSAVEVPADRGTPDADVLTTIDLFAGAGGLTEGFRQAGRFVPVAAVEMNTDATATFNANHGATDKAQNISAWLESARVPRVDVVVGGPPCQGFSLLGKRDDKDLRNRLWREYARTIVLSRPKFFVIENVAAFMASPEFRLLEKETQSGGSLQDYTIRYGVLNAADFGAAQARKRAIVIGSHDSVPPMELPLPTHRGNHRTVADAFEGITPRVEAMELPERTTTFDDTELPGVFRSDELHLTRHYRPVSLERFRSIPAGGNRFDIPYELLAECWKNHRSGSGDVMGRLHWDRPSVTIRTEFFKPEKGRYLHPTEHRAITPFEAARLQGFPDDYLWCGSKTGISRQIGNAVPIPLGSAIARHLQTSFFDA